MTRQDKTEPGLEPRPRFKVGDVVRVTHPQAWGSKGPKKGDVGFVVYIFRRDVSLGVTKSNIYCKFLLHPSEPGENGWLFYDYELEKVDVQAG